MSAINEQQKLEYLKDVNQVSDRIKQHIELQKSPQPQQQPTFERIPLPVSNNGMPPTLSLNATSGSGSTLEMWEETVDQRLNEIDNKLNNSDLSSMFASGKVEDMEF